VLTVTSFVCSDCSPLCIYWLFAIQLPIPYECTFYATTRLDWQADG